MEDPDRRQLGEPSLIAASLPRQATGEGAILVRSARVNKLYDLTNCRVLGKKLAVRPGKLLLERQDKSPLDLGRMSLLGGAKKVFKSRLPRDALLADLQRSCHPLPDPLEGVHRSCSTGSPLRPEYT